MLYWNNTPYVCFVVGNSGIRYGIFSSLAADTNGTVKSVSYVFFLISLNACLVESVSSTIFR